MTKDSSNRKRYYNWSMMYDYLFNLDVNTKISLENKRALINI